MIDVTDTLSGLKRQTASVADRLKADMLVYSGNIGMSAYADHHLVDHFIAKCRRRDRRRNVVLILTTDGGSADTAYRIARCLQRNYRRVAIYVRGRCKSAGTLLALAADELVMPDTGELGPLDIQLYKPDELGEMSSGLTPIQALSTLQGRAFDLFEYHFLEIKRRSLGQITTKSASEIATNLTVGLLNPVYAQIDPMRLGELDRAVRITLDYGGRLNRGNLKEGGLAKLVAEYPSHGFVIDREEARELFTNVREPSDDEESLVEGLDPWIEDLLQDAVPYAYLEDLFDEVLNAMESADVGESPVEGGGDSAEEEPPDSAGDGQNQREVVTARRSVSRTGSKTADDRGSANTQEGSAS